VYANSFFLTNKKTVVKSFDRSTWFKRFNNQEINSSLIIHNSSLPKKTSPTTFSIMNTSLLKIGALLVAVFFAGIFVRGEMARRAELRRELDEIKAQPLQTMEQVKAANASYAHGRKELLDQTLALYKELDNILAAKSANSKQIRDLDNKLDAQASRIKAEIDVLEDLIKDGF
jgi:hypothetical protein